MSHTTDDKQTDNDGGVGDNEKVKHKRKRVFSIDEAKGEGIYKYLLAFTDDMHITNLVKKGTLYNMYVEASKAMGVSDKNIAGTYDFYSYLRYLKVDEKRMRDGVYYCMREGVTKSSSVARDPFIKVWRG